MGGNMDLENYNAKPDKTIRQHNEELLECVEQLIALGYVQDDKVIALLKDACKYHDYGKVNAEFQKRVKSEKKIMFDPKKEISHNILSLYFLDKSRYSDLKDYYIVQYAIAYHHNYCDINEVMQNKIDLIKQLLAPFPTYPIRPMGLLDNIQDARKDPTGILVAGLLQKCDRCASAGAVAEYPNDFLTSSMSNLMDKWIAGWKNQQGEKGEQPRWNQMQMFCKKHSSENIIALAATGSGKTEAALHWLGDNKGFFVLPLRTAINAMYDRIRYDILENRKPEERIALLHSESAEYLLEKLEMDAEEVDKYNALARKFSLPLTITTMDQLFDFVFHYPCYEIKLATLSYSKIIIDEIQMYNAELLAYLIFGLEKIVEMGGKVAIITATLAPFIEDKLREKIHFVKEAFPSELKRHSVKVMDEVINADDILDLYRRNQEQRKRNKILVICNTIKKAQEIYRTLEEEVLEEELHMLHSRYIRADREKLEGEIKKFAGSKRELGEAQNGIWISTSLVEASLDLDFDYLFTELQDLNSLFQRFGRCNRLGLKAIEEVNCFVYLKIDAGLFSCEYIDEVIYNLSKDKLLKFAENQNESLMTEERKSEMLKVFSMENLKESHYLREFEDTYKYMKDIRTDAEGEKQKLRHILSQDVIPYCIYEKNEDKIRKMENQLKEMGLTSIQKRDLIHKIKRYTVSIPFYVYRNHLKNINRGKAIPRGCVTISGYEIIPIIGCTYTPEKGFESLEDKEVNDPMIW